MSAVLDTKLPRGAAVGLDWLPVIAGLLLLYVSTFYDLATWLWQQDDHAHGPIILAIIVWLIWERRAALFTAPSHPAPASGFALLIFGLLLASILRPLPSAPTSCA